mmetsp:Transcript_78932/g.136879  ORF Transcript_78932/g.136879 Transcript_78932/m.136879 type:complete len:126 (-) Transcript_78932:610-987(-)
MSRMVKNLLLNPPSLLIIFGPLSRIIKSDSDMIVLPTNSMVGWRLLLFSRMFKLVLHLYFVQRWRLCLPNCQLFWGAKPAEKEVSAVAVFPEADLVTSAGVMDPAVAAAPVTVVAAESALAVHML